MKKEDEQIMVVERQKLLSKNNFQGFVDNNENNDFEEIILKNYKYMRRGDAEINHDFKQPIAYCIIINDKNQVFAYQRGLTNSGDYNEKRLEGKWSWGTGGHIDKVDSEKNNNPIVTSMLREISEEVEMTGNTKQEHIVLGYINDDSDDVGKVHFGILYLVKTNAENVLLKGKESVIGKFMDINELEGLLGNKDVIIESWSKIALEPIKRYISN